MTAASGGSSDLDDCTGCQRRVRTRPGLFLWQEVFVMRLCTPCVLGLVLARPLRGLRTLLP